MKLALVALTALFGFSFAAPVFAQEDICDLVDVDSGEDVPAFCQDQNSSTGADNALTGSNGILTRVVDILTTIAAVAAVIGIIIGGIMYTTSNGDASRASRGREAIIYSLVGLVIAIFARVIVLFVLERVG